MLFRQLFDPTSSTYTYLLADEETREAVIIDPVIDQLDRDTQLIHELGLTLLFTLDTHVHADHVTASGSLANRLGAKTVLSERSGVGYADVLVKEGDHVSFGRHHLEVRETPGHTDGCLTFVTDDRKMVFTGDALLIRGSGRTDFQQGNSRLLFRGIHEKIFSLPDSTIVYPGHDYKGRMCSSVGEEKRWNPRVGVGKTEDQFAEIMANLQLAPPKQLAVALPANLHCGVPRGLPHDAEGPTEQRWAPIEVSGADVPEVTTDWVAANPAAGRLVDVREVEEYTGPLGHIETSELVPLGTVGQTAAAWDRALPVILVCRSGGRSAKAAMELRALGFKKVASMRGGMTRWNEAHLPVVGAASAIHA
jgi:glyoxylase-like metal-dependent hydrolase (beta-lactamase superfamily II)/rhodanese-related sulfurtransferase